MTLYHDVGFGFVSSNTVQRGIGASTIYPSLSPPTLSSNGTKRGQAALSRVAAIPCTGTARHKRGTPWQISRDTLIVLVQSLRAVKKVRRCPSSVAGVEILAQWGQIGFSYNVVRPLAHGYGCRRWALTQTIAGGKRLESASPPSDSTSRG